MFRGSRLFACGNVKIPTDAASDGERCQRAALAILQWISGVNAKPTRLAFEWPQIYQRKRGKTKGDPNDLPGLAGVGMALAGMLEIIIRIRDPRNGVELGLTTFKPGEWKGQQKKAVTAHHIRAALDPAELRLLPDQHDAIDAAGIGLTAEGRLRLMSAHRRVFPGAT